MNKECLINTTKLNEQHTQTLNQIIELSKTNKRVLCVRPTSWGKSYNVIRHLINYYNNKCLLIVPTINLVNQYKQFNLNINIITMSKLRYLTNIEEKDLFEDIDYVIIDEAHHICSRTTCGVILDNLLNNYNLKCLGFTATPERSDNLNILYDFYNGIQVQPLYLDEAIKQNVLPTLEYVRSFADIDNTQDKFTRKMKEINRYDFEHLFNVPSILKRHIRKDRLNNFKCIVYIPKNTMNDNTILKINKWFEEAFPTYKINIYTQSWKQRPELNKSELQKFQEIKSKDNIDIMVNIDMLNEGNHIENVYTVILLRYTRSVPKYLQQIGRAINTHNINYKQPLIIDIVSNITRLMDKNEIVSLDNYGNGVGYIGKEMYYNNINIVDELYPYMDKLNSLLRISKPWTTEEDDYLMLNYNGNNTSELAQHLGRTYYSIVKRLNRLGVNTNNIKLNKLDTVKQFILDNPDKQFSRNYLSVKFGVNYRTLNKWILENEDINCIMFNNITNTKSKEILKIEQGIAEGYITNKKTITNILKDFNLPCTLQLKQRLITYLKYHNLEYVKNK